MKAGASSIAISPVTSTRDDSWSANAPPPVDLSGWGRYPVVRGRERRSENLEAITRGAVLSRGLGRSYGDSSLPPPGHHVVCGTPLADRLLEFDPGTGLLRVEAGLPLYALNRWSLPRCWFTPVTPGTQFVTIGGMVAADVHGKNHHVNGCFGEHVEELRLRVADGRVLSISERVEPELFRATLGGMGLTGHILEVVFQMERIPSPWIWQESERVSHLEILIERLQEAGKSWPFTVTWVDSMRAGESERGRGIVIKGRWAEPDQVRKEFRFPGFSVGVPFTMPNWLLSPSAVRAFNLLNYWRHGRAVKSGVVNPITFFYPLDSILDWNRLYGRRGFTQYQCVLPIRGSLAPHLRFFERVIARGGAYLCVVKDCGGEGRGMLSFPKPGITFACDIPIGAQTQSLVDELNELVIAEGGRVYLAKDAFTRPEHFRAMEPRLDAWLAVRRRWDPRGSLGSAQSVRVLGR